MQRVVDKCLEQAGAPSPTGPQGARAISYRVFLTALAALAFRCFGAGAATVPGASSSHHYDSDDVIRVTGSSSSNPAQSPGTPSTAGWTGAGGMTASGSTGKAASQPADLQDPCGQVLSLLQTLDASGGKQRINACRTGAVVGMFNLQPVADSE